LRHVPKPQVIFQGAGSWSLRPPCRDSLLPAKNSPFDANVLLTLSSLVSKYAI
jgi:hypothetical protein